jgi:hypothetical protein
MALSQVEKEAGYKTVPQPPVWAQPILRRIGRGYLMLTLGEKGATASYDDGTPVRIERRKNGVLVHEPMSVAETEDWARRGWLIPIDGERLFEGFPPQRYRTRNPTDGPLPRIVDKHGQRAA